jgi:hypothetical protein
MALVVAAVIAPAAQAQADAGAGPATCTLEARVAFDAGGAIVQRGAGTARCAGAIGPTMVDPGPVPAFISGTAQRGVLPCAPTLLSGRLRMLPLRLVSLDPHREVTFDGAWKATSGLLIDGTGRAEGLTSQFRGSVQFTPDDGGCFLVMELVIEAGRRATRRDASAGAATGSRSARRCARRSGGPGRSCARAARPAGRGRSPRG